MKDVLPAPQRAPHTGRGLCFVLAALLASVVSAQAQWLPTAPISFADGRVVLAAEVTVTVASDDPGFFNYTDYEYSSISSLRVALGAEVRASRWLQLLGEFRVDHGWPQDYLGPVAPITADHVEPFAMYARIRPWSTRRFDIQVGRLPPAFGAFGRASYGVGNLLIGTPLAYQYLTSLRPDALPQTIDDLLRMRGRGWLSSFPLGSREPDRGLPLINSVHSDEGLQVRGVNGMVEWVGAVTNGSLSNPVDDNRGRQVVGRVVVRPLASFSLGASASRGSYLNRTLEQVLGEGQRLEDGVQRAFSVDAEYSEGRFLARGEIIRSLWTLPMPLPGFEHEDLAALSILGEGRYRIFPGLQLAARAERLGFNRFRVAGMLQPWEAPVRRLELGASYAVIRNVLVKASWQRNTRQGGRILRDTLGALQMVYWF